ncbi:hypothetical protein [Agromyces bauzanensis]|uniref:Uncharacterized protein n=1 Tax=Agromyces bauzanensis TaxID=1308924 RepID=A0A917PM52_9MICO|nr:hypothetical protein [Agromyces bauzanensis]GGJ83914.1 hypothetical protein GCM10011372_22840 [Agromyces bauzanensis]
MSDTNLSGPGELADTAVIGAPEAPATRPAASDPEASPLSRPTVRWGALVWSLIFGAVGATSLWVVVDRDSRDAVDEWLLDLTPLAATLYLLLALGALIAVFGLVALIRRGERARV